MITSFRCKDTKALFETGKTRRFRAIQAAVERKLIMLHAAQKLEDLRSPPGNRLEELSGDRVGQHSRSTQHPHQQAVATVFSLGG